MCPLKSVRARILLQFIDRECLLSLCTWHGALCKAQHQALGQQKLCLKEASSPFQGGQRAEAVAEAWRLTDASPLRLLQAVPQRKKGLGSRDWSGTALMQDFSGAALAECKHPFSPQDWSSCQDFEKQVTQVPLGWLDKPQHGCCGSMEGAGWPQGLRDNT